MTTLHRGVVLSRAPRDAQRPISTHHPIVPSLLFPFVAPLPSNEPCSAVSEVKGKESMLQWLLRCLSKPRQGYLQTCANCRSGSRYLPELRIAHA